MKKKDTIVSILAGLILGIIAIQSGLAKQFISYPPPARASVTTDEIISILLNSHNTWKTMNGEATTVWHVEGKTQTWISKVKIEQPLNVRLEVSQSVNSPSILWISGPTGIYIENHSLGVYTEMPLPAFAKNLSLLPSRISDISRGRIYRHPVAMLMPSPIADLIYPTGFAQRGGEYNLIGEEEVDGRHTWILDWQFKDSSGLITMKARYWIDNQTGLILKAITFGGEKLDEVFEETMFNKISFDTPLPNSAFSANPSSGLKKVSAEDYAAFQP
jgi:outer membrane lipoprotein-sorting protein